MSTPRKRKQVASPPPTEVSSPTSQSGRVFTESDELRLLKTVKKITEQHPSSSTQNSTITVDTATFTYINSKLGSKFTHAQITDKLRRLRVKFRKQNRSKSLIKTPHDQALFDIAQSIWGKKAKKKVRNPSSSDGEEEVEDEQNGRHEREEVDLEKYPVLMGEFSKYAAMSLGWREALKSLGSEKLKEMNEMWMMIGIEEAEIVIRKANLVKDQAKSIMEALGDRTANGYDDGGML